MRSYTSSILPLFAITLCHKFTTERFCASHRVHFGIVLLSRETSRHAGHSPHLMFVSEFQHRWQLACKPFSILNAKRFSSQKSTWWPIATFGLQIPAGGCFRRKWAVTRMGRVLSVYFRSGCKQQHSAANVWASPDGLTVPPAGLHPSQAHNRPWQTLWAL